MKISKILMFLLVAALVMAFSPQRCLASMNTLSSGTLSEYYDGITATDGWVAYDYDVPKDGIQFDEDTTLGWAISYDSGANLWTYEYTFTTPDPDRSDPDDPWTLSNIIFQVSKEFTIDDYETDFGGLIELKSGEEEWTELGSAGIKFNILQAEQSRQTIITFDSPRQPVWGSFYAKDGQGAIPGGTKEEAIAYNTGLTNPDGAFLAVPDTIIPVPGAVLLGILGLGVAGLKLRKYA